MKAKVRKFKKSRCFEKGGHHDVFLVPEMLSDSVLEFIAHPVYEGWYRCKESDFTYHISWLIPVEVEEDGNS